MSDESRKVEQDYFELKNSFLKESHAKLEKFYRVQRLFWKMSHDSYSRVIFLRTNDDRITFSVEKMPHRRREMDSLNCLSGFYILRDCMDPDGFKGFYFEQAAKFYTLSEDPSGDFVFKPIVCRLSDEEKAKQYRDYLYSHMEHNFLFLSNPHEGNRLGLIRSLRYSTDCLSLVVSIGHEERVVKWESDYRAFILPRICKDLFTILSPLPTIDEWNENRRTHLHTKD